MRRTQSDAAMNRQALPSSAMDTSITLGTAYAAGKRAWSEISLSYEQFHLHVAHLGYASPAVPACPVEVYLCAACTNRQNAAYQALEGAYFPALKVVIHDVVREQPTVDDVLQEVRTRLFVGSSPKIATYRGIGSLCSWLRTVAVNASRDKRRATSMERGRMHRLENVPRAVLTNSELEDAHAFHGHRDPVFRQAWSAAVFSLASPDRQLLHHFFVSGLSIDVLAPLYCVHRATVARRIRRAIVRVRRRVAQVLASHYPDLDTQELRTLAWQGSRDIDVCSGLVEPTNRPVAGSAQRSARLC
jgi:RNA polymerase sigma-70 factor